MDIATLFGGFGGVDIGAKQAGLNPAWSIELDPCIGEVAAANLGHRIYICDLLACDPTRFDAVDVLHASPPCPNFSVAKTGRGESKLDIQLARKVAAFVTALRPPVFTLENVWAYRGSRSWAIIQDALYGAGYWVSIEHVNAADYGVPQTRKRMIVRAVRGGFVPYLPQTQPWVGWYAAIEDLIDTLPESQFAPWQLERLPDELKASFLAQVQGEGGDGVRFADEPMQTVTVAHGAAKYRAFIVPGGNDSFPLRCDGEPVFTITTSQANGGCRAWLVDGANTTEGQLSIRKSDQPALTVTSGGPKHPARALLKVGRVVAMTPRALARFQAFPDWYELPDNAQLAAKGIGNAVPPLLYQRIIQPLLQEVA